MPVGRAPDQLPIGLTGEDRLASRPSVVHPGAELVLEKTSKVIQTPDAHVVQFKGEEKR